MNYECDYLTCIKVELGPWGTYSAASNPALTKLMPPTTRRAAADADPAKLPLVSLASMGVEDY